MFKYYSNIIFNFTIAFLLFFWTTNYAIPYLTSLAPFLQNHSDMINSFTNFLIILVAYGALKTSEMSLQANDAPRLYNPKTILQRSANGNNFKVISYIENLGASPAMKTFLLVRFTGVSKEKTYYLSQPHTIYENVEHKEPLGEIEVEIEHNEVLKEIYSSLIGGFGGREKESKNHIENNLKVYLIANDFFGRTYLREIVLRNHNDQINDSFKPFKLVSKWGFKYHMISRYKNKAIAQENTYPQREERALEEWYVKDEENDEIIEKQMKEINKNKDF